MVALTPPMAGRAVRADLDAMGRRFAEEYRPSSLIGRLAQVEEVASLAA